MNQSYAKELSPEDRMLGGTRDKHRCDSDRPDSQPLTAACLTSGVPTRDIARSVSGDSPRTQKEAVISGMSHAGWGVAGLC